MENYEIATERVPFEQSLAVADDGEKMVADLTSAKAAYCSMKADDHESKAKLFKAMNNPEKRLGDCINMTIEATDVYVEVVDCINEQTGIINQCPRIVIIDKNGVGYQAVSIGVFSALKKVFRVFGEPHWETPLKLKVKQITKGDRKMLTFDVE